MKDTDAAYLAALIDRGYIGIDKSSKAYAIKISIQSSDQRLLDWIVETTKIGRIYRKQWEPYTKEIIKILDEVEPYLILKKEQAYLVRRYLTECRGIQGHSTNIEEKKLREFLRLECKKFNASKSIKKSNAKGTGTKSKESGIQSNRSTNSRSNDTGIKNKIPGRR